MKTFGQQIKERRERLFPDKELYIKAVQKILELQSTQTDKSFTRAENIVNAMEEMDVVNWKDPGVDGITTVTIWKICELLDVEERDFTRGNVRDRKTPIELLEELEPGGPGTIEQRAFRLAAHSVVSFGRACEILRISRYDLPSLETLGCTCIECQDMIVRLKTNCMCVPVCEDD